MWHERRNRRGTKILAMALLATCGVIATPASGSAEQSGENSRFTLVMLPDAQIAVQNKPELFTAQTEWILNHREDRKIAFVAHVGDIVEWPSRLSDWQRAVAALYPLNQKMPYAISLGNHDLDAWACTPAATCDPNQAIATDRRATMFNSNFPLSVFQNQGGLLDAFPAGQSDNTAIAFQAAGIDWLVVSLKYNPTDEELAWADQVIASHPGYQVIVNAHEYQQGNSRTTIGDRIWNTVVRKHSNVQLVLSGHYTSAGRQIDLGDSGNTVFQIQADYQTYNAAQINENSYLRLMEFDVEAKTIKVRTFSPYCETTGECPAFKTDLDNQFDLTEAQAGGPGSAYLRWPQFACSRTVCVRV